MTRKQEVIQTIFDLLTDCAFMMLLALFVVICLKVIDFIFGF